MTFWRCTDTLISKHIQNISTKPYESSGVASIQDPHVPATAIEGHCASESIRKPYAR